MHTINFKVIKLPSLLFLLLLSCVAFAQDTLPHKYAITAGYHHGFVIAHRPLIVPLQQNKADGVEVSFVFHSNGTKNWHHTYGFPEIGLSLATWNLGNQEELGSSVTLIPYVDFPLAKGKRSSFDLKFGWGLGYVEKKFDADDNYKNVAIGSRLNFSLILQPHYKIILSDRVIASAGISLTHYSNGSVATPNLGLNIASLTAGITVNLGKPLELPTRRLTEFQKSSNYSIYGAVSSKQTYPADGKNYFACSLVGDRNFRISRKSSFSGGADLFYDHSIYKKLEELDMEVNNSLETLRFGIHGGYELVVSNLSFVLNMGGYLYSKLDDGIFYHRIGLRYQFNEHLFAALHIKAHWGKADYIEWGIGYKINKGKNKIHE